MASKRRYAYYIKGNKIAIIEEGLGSGVCSLDGYSNQTTCEAAGGTWTENAFSKDDGKWMSPIAKVTDGLEIQYAYTPTYRVNDADDTLAVTAYTEEAGTGLLNISISNVSLTKDDPIVITGSEKWNGLHHVNATVSNGSAVTLTTKYNGPTVSESFTVLKDVSELRDESFELDLSRYQSMAVVYYLKGMLAEDMGQADLKEYYMREFKKQLEKSTSALKRGPYMIQGFKEMR